MHPEITELIPVTHAAIRAADVAAERVFAQIGERTYGQRDATVLAERVLDVDSDARDILNAELSAYVRLLIAPTELYWEDRTDEVYELAGLDIATGSLAFRTERDASSAAFQAGMGERHGEYVGVPLYVLSPTSQREHDVQRALAWLRVRPASAGHWAILVGLLAV